MVAFCPVNTRRLNDDLEGSDILFSVLMEMTPVWIPGVHILVNFEHSGSMETTTCSEFVNLKMYNQKWLKRWSIFICVYKLQFVKLYIFFYKQIHFWVEFQVAIGKMDKVANDFLPILGLIVRNVLEKLRFWTNSERQPSSFFERSSFLAGHREK